MNTKRSKSSSYIEDVVADCTKNYIEQTDFDIDRLAAHIELGEKFRVDHKISPKNTIDIFLRGNETTIPIASVAISTYLYDRDNTILELWRYCCISQQLLFWVDPFTTKNHVDTLEYVKAMEADIKNVVSQSDYSLVKGISYAFLERWQEENNQLIDFKLYSGQDLEIGYKIEKSYLYMFLMFGKDELKLIISKTHISDPNIDFEMYFSMMVSTAISDAIGATSFKDKHKDLHFVKELSEVIERLDNK